MNDNHLEPFQSPKTIVCSNKPLRKRPKAKWQGAGAGAGESSAVREASRKIKASDGADPCPLCARASGVTAVTVKRPCCACPGSGSRQGARIPATTRGGRALGPAPGRPPLAVCLVRRFQGQACQGPPPARSYGPVGLEGRPRILNLAFLESSNLRQKTPSNLHFPRSKLDF